MNRFIPDERSLIVNLQPGTRDGYSYLFKHEGEPHVDGESGDLNFRIRQQK